MKQIINLRDLSPSREELVLYQQMMARYQRLSQRKQTDGKYGRWRSSSICLRRPRDAHPRQNHCELIGQARLTRGFRVVAYILGSLIVQSVTTTFIAARCQSSLKSLRASKLDSTSQRLQGRRLYLGSFKVQFITTALIVTLDCWILTIRTLNFTKSQC